MQISICNGCVEYDGEPILSQIDFTVHDGEKIAVVGRNGCGKTTLLKALTGEVELVEGTGEQTFGFYKSGNPVIGHLKQAFDSTEKRTMEEEILSAYRTLTDIEEQMETYLCKMEKDENAVHTYSRLHEDYERLGGYTYKKEYLTAVKKFGFSTEDLKKPLCAFSGGQRTKVSLLTLLLSKPEVLLLDEPTNHLDLEAIEWLENYLQEYKNACIIVSHDRMFLDKTVRIVYEIEYGETKKYMGNYTAFVKQKKENYEKALKDSMARKKEIERLSALVERFRYKAHKAAMAQAKLKQIERIGAVNTPVGYDNATFRVSFQPTEETVEKTVVFDKLVFGYTEPLGTIDTVIKRGQKLGIIGRNGCGKSTLIRTLMKSIPPLSGFAKFGLHADVGYFDQTLTQNSSPLTVFEFFHDAFPLLTDEEVRSSLGAFLFSGEDVFKTVDELSGGEKVRLALCKIFKNKPNVLVLDEPTNHMDIIGKDTLESMLAAYKGTVITVSHDRYFIDMVCDRITVFENGNLNLYDCRYHEYEEIRPTEETVEEKREVVKKEKPLSAENERKKKLHRIGVLEGKIAAFDQKKSVLERRISEDASVYTDYKKIEEINLEIQKLEAEEAPLLEEWTQLMEETEE